MTKADYQSLRDHFIKKYPKITDNEIANSLFDLYLRYIGKTHIRTGDYFTILNGQNQIIAYYKVKFRDFKTNIDATIDVETIKRLEQIANHTPSYIVNIYKNGEIIIWNTQDKIERGTSDYRPDNTTLRNTTSYIEKKQYYFPINSPYDRLSYKIEFIDNKPTIDFIRRTQESHSVELF